MPDDTLRKITKSDTTGLKFRGWGGPALFGAVAVALAVLFWWFLFT